MKKRLSVNKWIKETIKYYGVELVLKYPWECLFLMKSKLSKSQ